jgi:hypothetical protein
MGSRKWPLASPHYYFYWKGGYLDVRCWGSFIITVSIHYAVEFFSSSSLSSWFVLRIVTVSNYLSYSLYFIWSFVVRECLFDCLITSSSLLFTYTSTGFVSLWLSLCFGFGQQLLGQFPLEDQKGAWTLWMGSVRWLASNLLPPFGASGMGGSADF